LRAPSDLRVPAAFLALAAVVWLGVTLGARADDRSLLAFSAGQYNIADQAHAAAEVGVEWRGARRWWVLYPIAGGAVTHQGALNLYLGFTFDLPIGRGFALRPSFAPGYYRGGGGKDLGYPLEFRSGLEAGWRFAGGTRLGVELYHLSNASLGDRNPGENALVLTLAVPVARLFGRRPAHRCAGFQSF
jgi:lipid A 3-O-deacylase